MLSYTLERSRAAAPQQLIERALELSRADRCLVIAEESSRTHLRWANNRLTTNGCAKHRLLTIIAVMDGRAGSAVGVMSQAGATDESLTALVRAAETAAQSSQPALDAEPFVSATQPAPHWDEPLAETSFHIFDSLVTQLGEAMTAAGRQRLLFGYAEHQQRSTFLASSTGLRLRDDNSSGYVQMNMRSPSYGDSVWVGSSTLDFSDVNVASLCQELNARFAWSRKKPLTLPAGRYETLLSPSAVADLMINLYEAAGARDAYDGRSVFGKPGQETRVGERLCDAKITLRSDPMAKSLRCAPFVIAASSNSVSSVFDNGFWLEPTNWITDGKLAALVQTRHSAKLTGLATTPRIDNLILEGPPGRRTLSEMISRTASGLLVTCLWYLREVDAQTLQLTGLTRDGVFLIKDGEIVGAVNNFRFNESPVGLLGRVAEVGISERTLAREAGGYFPRTVMPWLRVEHFNMSGISEV